MNKGSDSFISSLSPAAQTVINHLALILIKRVQKPFDSFYPFGPFTNFKDDPLFSIFPSLKNSGKFWDINPGFLSQKSSAPRGNSD